MIIYLLRHAIAEEKDPKKYPMDGERPLTKEGERKMERAAQGMKEAGFHFDLVLTSPFARALKTAQIVVNTYEPKPPMKELQGLASGAGTSELAKAIPNSAAIQSVLLVGHEPHLTRLVSDLLFFQRDFFPMSFKKGGLVRIDFEGRPAPGKGELVFVLPPRVLRGLRN